jgi:hypothetical protein
MEPHGRPASRPRAPLARLAVASGLGACLLAASAAGARAADEVPLRDLGAVTAACEEAQSDGPRRLYVVEIPAGAWRFGSMALDPAPLSAASSEPSQSSEPADRADAARDAEAGTLFVDTRANLRALGGRVALMPAGLEPIGFRVTRARGRQLELARREGASLRLGFFLGQDDRDRTLCVVRPAGGQTLVRAEIAFAELVRPDGSVVAREDTERLRALVDDDAPDRIPGSGPRARVDPPYATRGAVPDAWRQALVAAGQPGASVARALAACHAEGVARGAAEHSRVVVRLAAIRGGAVRRAEVELADNGDEAEAQCVARAIGAATLPALGPGAWGQTAATAGGAAGQGPGDAELVLSVPVRLAGAPAPAGRPGAPAPAGRPGAARGPAAPPAGQPAARPRQ